MLRIKYKLKVSAAVLALPFLLHSFNVSADIVESTLSIPDLQPDFSAISVMCIPVAGSNSPQIETAAQDVTSIVGHYYQGSTQSYGTSVGSVNYSASNEANSQITQGSSGWNFGNYSSVLPGAFGTPGSFLEPYEQFQFQSPLFGLQASGQYGINADAFTQAFGFAPGTVPSLPGVTGT